MRIHLEWGARALSEANDTAIIVDCLSFSSALSVACARGAIVFPFGTREGGIKLASGLNVECVGKRKEHGLSLSPPSLNKLKAGQNIVLPSPNGSNLSTRSHAATTMAGALRNAQAVALAAMKLDTDIMIVAAGERWRADGSLRPAYEDQLAAGAIAAYLDGNKSAETQAAIAIFRAAEENLFDALAACVSGQELIGHGFEDDVRWASELNATDAVPRLHRHKRTYEDAGLLQDDMPDSMMTREAICYYSNAQS